MMQNSPQWVIAFYAILRANAVVVPVNPMNREDELRHVVLRGLQRLAQGGHHEFRAAHRRSSVKKSGYRNPIPDRPDCGAVVRISEPNAPAANCLHVGGSNPHRRQTPQLPRERNEQALPGPDHRHRDRRCCSGRQRTCRGRQLRGRRHRLVPVQHRLFGRPRLRPAGAHPRRDAGEPRLPAARQGDRRAGGHLRVHRAQPGDGAGRGGGRRHLRAAQRRRRQRGTGGMRWRASPPRRSRA